MLKILLLGHNGQLGTDLKRVHQQYQHEFELIPVGRNTLDVSDLESLSSFLKNQPFDILINCTSYHKTDEVEKSASLAFTINAHAVKTMAEVSQNKNAKFFHISTDYVFSGENKTPYLETDPAGPINVYGASKAMGERLALLINPQSTYILRVASLFGIAGASGKGGNFVETMIKVGKEKGVLKVVNDVTMSPTSTLTIAQTIFKLLRNNTPSGIYHVVNSGQATWYEFAKTIIEKTKIPADVLPVTSQEFPTVALRPRFSVLNNTKAQNLAGPIPHWTEALDLYLKEKGHIS